MPIDINSLIWEFYNRLKDDGDSELVPGQERYNPNRFYRTHNVFRMSHFSGRVLELGPGVEPPTGSIFHLMDDISYPEHSDTLRIDDQEFVNRETFKKWMFHVKSFNLDGPIKVEDKYIYRQSGMPKNFMEFRRRYQTQFRYANTLEEIPARKELLPILNYNPLFRVIIIGRLQLFRKIQLILATVLNTAHKLAEMYPEKNQYVFIPWSEEVYSRELFLRSRSQLDVSTIMRPKSFHYIVMMHLMNYLWESANTSIFRQVPEETRSKITLVLTVGGRYLFYRLDDMANLNVKNKAYYRIANQLNELAIAGRVPENAPEEEKAKLAKVINVTKVNVESSVTDAGTTTKVVATPDPITPVTELPEAKEEKSVPQAEDTAPTEELKKEQALVEAAKTIPIKHLEGARRANPIAEIIRKMPSVIAPLKAAAPTKENVSEPAIKAITQAPENVTAVMEITAQEMDLHAKEYMDELDEGAKRFIEESETLTPAQKTRAMGLAEKYKTLELDGVSIEKLMTSSNDITLHENILPINPEHFPDKSLMKSSIINFDEVYLEKTFKKDLVSCAVAFQKNGMFLTGIESKKNVTQLNNNVDYAFSYEDISGKKSTVRFTMPAVDSDGHVLINGVSKILKKQHIGLPIYKISGEEVSLSSQYNKTLVSRTTTKSHSFFHYVDKLVNRPEAPVYLEFGTTKLNSLISCEYTELAERYKLMDVTNSNYNSSRLWDGKKYSFFFQHAHRQEHAGIPQDTLDGLEEHYGTYLGKTNETTMLFIDHNNTVHFVDKIGGEVLDAAAPSSILSILRSILPQPVVAKMKPLTEWTTIKILDKELPIAFLLAYRYGLRETLAHLGAQYTITGRKDKLIVGTSSNPDVVFHLSRRALHTSSSDKAIIQPSIPEVSESLEDTTIPRICVADSVDKALLAFPFSEEERKAAEHIDLYVYSIDKDSLADADMYHNRELVEDQQVFDAHVTGESWILKPTEATHVGIIRVNDQAGESITFTPLRTSEFGDSVTTGTCRWEILTQSPGIILKDDARRYVPKPDDIPIKFADRTLWVSRYPLAHSLILAGLAYFDIGQYSMSEFESKDVYYKLLVDKGFSTNYLKGINSFYDIFIDAVTYGLLRQMEEPTNVRDLLIRATVLLTTTDHHEASSEANFRTRSYEQFTAILYNEMARQFATYQTKHGKGNIFSINPNAVYLRIIQNAAMVPVESVNPLQDIKEKTSITFSGVGGRTSQSFVVDDRRYPQDGVGILSEATVDNQKVAINGVLSLDPSIVDTRGVSVRKPLDELEPSNILSITALTFPFATNDDSKRANFINIQTSHQIPSAVADSSRVRTGYERVIAHRTAKTFAGTTKKNGTVTKVDDDNKMIEVTYADKTKEVFPFGDTYVEFEGMHFTQELVHQTAVGKTVRPGDVITYNPSFFTRDILTGQVDLSLGVLAKVAFMETDSTLEDSTEISTSLSEKLTINPANARIVAMTKNTAIHYSVKVGDKVLNTDPLVVFEEGLVGDIPTLNTDDPETLAMLSSINQNTLRAKYTGTVVKIEAFYGCPISEMRTELASIVKNASKISNNRSKMAEGTADEAKHIASTPIPIGSRYKGTIFESNTVMLIYYIKESIQHMAGDKLVLANQLKCTTMGIFPQSVVTESGIPVDALFSTSAVANRIVLSPLYYGISARILERVQGNMIDIYRRRTK